MVVFRPNYLFKESFVIIPSMLLLLVVIISILASKGTNLFIMLIIFFLCVIALSLHRVIVYKYGERVIFYEDKLIVKRPHNPSSSFNFKNMQKITVVKFYGGSSYTFFPYTYVIVLNSDLLSKEDTKISKDNAFWLRNGWNDKDVRKLLDYVQNNLQIQVDKQIYSDFWYKEPFLTRKFF